MPGVLGFRGTEKHTATITPCTGSPFDRIFYGMHTDHGQPDPGPSKFWIWVMVIILLVLLAVPVFSIGMSIQKTGWVPVRRLFAPKATPTPEVIEDEPVRDGQPPKISLRDRVEKVAAAVIHIPKLESKTKQIQIQVPKPSVEKASKDVRVVLSEGHYQFVQAIDQDKIRLIVVMASKDWPKLSNELQSAAEGGGFVYRGPSSTSVAEGADTVVAEIEIKRKPENPKKR